MNDLFGHYVPPDLVTEMANDPWNYSLASEKRELSVLFSDIRGFTSISEDLDAVELSGLLNRFLTPMTEVVHVTHGTIDKYMGDAIMAFWGAPIIAIAPSSRLGSSRVPYMISLAEIYLKLPAGPR